MKPRRHRDTEKLAADERGSTRIRNEEIKSARIRVNLRLVIAFAVCLCVSVGIVLSSTQAQQTPPPPLEGCLKCHDKIEPMHRFGPTSTLDKLDNGKDALGLTCTACHGGNPVATTKEEAHVQPRFPGEWMRDGKFRVPENSGPLLARESKDFVRFLNPGDFRVATKTCGSSECHTSETANATRSMMTHGAMLWGAALYNHGPLAIKA